MSNLARWVEEIRAAQPAREQDVAGCGCALHSEACWGFRDLSLSHADLMRRIEGMTSDIRTTLDHIDELREALAEACNNLDARVRGDVLEGYSLTSRRAELETIARHRKLIGGGE